MITPEEKADIYRAARETFLDWYGDKLGQKAACLYWNQVAMRELTLRGHRPLLQAGTLLWRMIPAARDNGICATHFGYEYTPNHPFSVRAVREGHLPEVHIWAGLPEENCLVDFSTGGLMRV